MPLANPGYVPTVAAAGPIQSDWGNAVRDRTIQYFATTALRDASLTAPYIGQLCVITTGAFSYVNATPGAGTLLEYQSVTTGWTKPWWQPWGPVAAVANATVAQTGITTVADLTSLSITFTAVANRRYRALLTGQVLSTVATDSFLVSIADSANVALQQKAQAFIAASSQLPFYVQLDTSVPAVAGSYTFKGRLQRSSGTGTLSTATAGATQPLQLSVEDIGPSANAA